MLKRACLVIAILFLLSLFSSCSMGEKTQEMCVTPSEFSQETRDVLAAIGDETAFFDYQIDETVQSVRFYVKIYENGAWIDGGSTENDVSVDGTCRFGLRLGEEACEIFVLNEDGWMRASLSLPEGLADFPLAGTIKRTMAREIVPEEPITLLVKAWTDQDILGSVDLDDYQAGEYEAAVAIEAVFSQGDRTET